MSLKIKKQPFNSIWICADSQEELGNTFLRFQEHYESPYFKGQIFTVGQVRAWYSKTYGADTYEKDWTGFNIPSSILKPFRDGLFDPLTPEEKALMELIKYRHDSFYIIGAQDQATLRHELSHALYGYSIKYKISIDQLCHKHKKELKKVANYILDKGYDKTVINDEIQAYVTDNDDEFIKKYTPSSIIDQINQLYSYHSQNC
jgi:hypothetical protein